MIVHSNSAFVFSTSLPLVVLRYGVKVVSHYIGNKFSRTFVTLVLDPFRPIFFFSMCWYMDLEYLELIAKGYLLISPDFSHRLVLSVCLSILYRPDFKHLFSLFLYAPGLSYKLRGRYINNKP